MPKDTQKYHYVSVGLLRGSWALEQFLQDAQRHHLVDQPGKLAALRLTEYYELVERGFILAGSIATPTAQPYSSSGNGSLDGMQASTKAVARGTHLQTEIKTTVEPSSDTERKADAALDYFLMATDEEED